MNGGATSGRAAAIADLERQLLAGVADAVGGARGAVLLDFPDHVNIGDNAIWAGEVELLRQLGVELRASSIVDHCDTAALRRALQPDDVVLVHGGGNLGDLWPRHQHFRELMLREFADRRVVQLPQTVTFTNDESAERARDALRAHPHLRVLVRDAESNRLIADAVGVEAVQTVPDPAFALGDRTGGHRGGSGTTWLLRTDHETSIDIPEGISVVDWKTLPRSQAERGRLRVERILERRVAVHRHGALARLATQSRSRRARRYVQRGFDLLRCSDRLVTDRLHGMIFGILMGVPTAVIPDRYGKIERFLATWPSLRRLVVVTDLTEAQEWATVQT